jgi:peptide/nickel transport system substrate-binding protein
MHTAPLRRRSGIALAAISLVAALGLSACAPAEPAGEPQANDAVMSVAIAAAPPSFDPAQLDEGPGTFVWSSLYETLLFVDNDGSIQPGAAESYEYSEDRTTLTLKLRDGLTFSNGDPVTSEDVVATLERTKATAGPQQSRFADVASFTAEDESTIVIQLNAPNASFLNFLAQAAGVVGHAATIDDEDSALRPVGSGPYVLSDTTIDGTTYVLERREDYWNAEAYPFKTFTVRVISDATALVNALSTGEVLGGSVQAATLPQIESAGLSIKEVTSAATMMLLLADRGGQVQPALADARVRQAINLAFDRDQIVEAVFSGYALPTDQSFNLNGEAFNEDVQGTYGFDPEAARELLEEAGYPDGFTLTMPSTVISTNFEPFITQALSDIGITTVWEPVPPANIASSVASGQYAAVVWIEGTNAAGREYANYFGPNAFLNPFKWQDPALTGLLEDVAQEGDDATRAELYREATALTVEEALNAPIVSMSAIWVTSADVVVVPDRNVPKTIRMFAPAS